MTLKIAMSDSSQIQPSVVMLVYGPGGVGKTTFSSTAPKPIIADCENGAKYFGLRGIKNVPIAAIRSWMDFFELGQLVKDNPEYETIVIDPIGELMEKLITHMKNKKDSKLVQVDGSPTMAGWGWLKSTLRDALKVLRDTGKHIIIIAHVQEKDDEGKIVKRPMVATKLSEELVNMVDIVGFMTVLRDGEDLKRVIMVEPDNEKYVAKDRTGQLGRIIPPDFMKIIEAARGTGDYEWMKETATRKTADNSGDIVVEGKITGKIIKEKVADNDKETKETEEDESKNEIPKSDIKKIWATPDVERINDKTRGRLLMHDEEDIIEIARVLGVTEEMYNDGYPDTHTKAAKLYGAVMQILGSQKQKKGEE
jgi:phage nucleotide-binding protein